MIRATTPTLKLTIRDTTIDLGDADEVYVAIKQGPTVIEITGDQLDIDGNVVECYMTQEQSLSLTAGMGAKVQINWTYGSGRRAATLVKEIHITEQLIGRVLE